MKMECINCHITLENDELKNKFNNICPMCHKKDSYIAEYIMDIKRISNDQDFINAMIKLHDEDPIEYQLKMSQFKTQIKQQKSTKIEEKSIPKCPTCGSTNIQKISGTKRWLSTGLFGLASSDIGKNMCCKNCGHKW